jgi:hypothetical protein
VPSKAVVVPCATVGIGKASAAVAQIAFARLRMSPLTGRNLRAQRNLRLPERPAGNSNNGDYSHFMRPNDQGAPLPACCEIEDFRKLRLRQFHQGVALSETYDRN